MSNLKSLTVQCIQNIQVMENYSEVMFCLIQDEEHNARLLPAPTEALFTHDVSVCPNSEGTVHV